MNEPSNELPTNESDNHPNDDPKSDNHTNV